MSKFVPNSFMVANAFVDEAMNKISDASVKIYLLIVRKTRGWTKESDALSLRQLEKLSKKSRPTVSKCLSELEEVGLIKKHHQSKYGNVYSPVDNYDLGEWIKFPSKKVLVKSLNLFKKEAVKNFNHFGYGEKISINRVGFSLKIAGKKSVVVKKFNHLNDVDNLAGWLKIFTILNGKWLNIFTTGGKEFLPQVVKNFNPQNTTIKNNYQNKKNMWFVLENLKLEICSIDSSFDTNEIFNADWFNREYNNFVGFNENRNHSDRVMVTFFAEWMLKARAKYAKMKTPAQRFSENKNSNGQQSLSENTVPEVINFASDKQLYNFARQLVFHPEFKDSFCGRGEDWQDAAKRMATLLSDPVKQKPYIPYLFELGFKPTKGAAA
ncbi:replication protein [Acinetobacter higginsii]|uniref:replication protein n=1 Tax=Acinetobacter higginsii TaxID=70347 RepID=UPI001F4A7AF2|nr:replication protein [Acinetobacter higginsii]MCH7381305.1 replication protein [Acinetobacter higginsii]